MAENEEGCQKLARGFLVLVDEARYDIKSQKFSHDMCCITQLMGENDLINSLNEKARTFNQNKLWKN